MGKARPAGGRSPLQKTKRLSLGRQRACPVIKNCSKIVYVAGDLGSGKFKGMIGGWVYEFTEKRIVLRDNLHLKFSKVLRLHILNDRLQFILLFQEIRGKKPHLLGRLNHRLSDEDRGFHPYG